MTLSAAQSLRLSDFDYDLPEALIAQEPCSVRDRSRLMVLRRDSDALEHRIFSDLEHYLVPGDLLVMNDTRVFPCRLVAKKAGGGKAEIFLLAEMGPNRWTALVKGSLHAGKKLILDRRIEAEIAADLEDGTKEVLFHNIPDIRTVLPEVGRTPLPPYVKREPSQADLERYQTVYATREGAVAAPTAGLHFTSELLESLQSRGIETATVTLHVGPGTFQPVRAEIITDHRMLPEKYEVSDRAASDINRAKAEGRRVIAIGTTSVRTIESAASENGAVRSGSGSSELFIYPGYRFRVIDAMVTNFHLPKSTLLMLVSAFAGRERMLAAYRVAVEERYRFYSYGDAMLIIPS
jgi:S-adenosylmethionine:tRNA ribosyltransferase-isomerase